MQDLCNTLKYIREPWDVVKEKWFLTRCFRAKQITDNTDMTINAILKNWPLYTHSKAPELVRSYFTA